MTSKHRAIGLGNDVQIPILYEDRSVLAIDKPPGWMLVPFSWQQTEWNLQAALVSGIASGAFWARSRNLKFLRHIHRLDAETSGILLLGKSPGAVRTYGGLFETRRMEKRYWAVVRGIPKERAWVCRLKLGPDETDVGRHKVDMREGKAAETFFRVLESDLGGRSLVEARPTTGRTHQIRIHLAAAGYPVVGDELYGGETPEANEPRSESRNGGMVRVGFQKLGLRAVGLAYWDPFTGKRVRILAPTEAFLACFRG